jgi:hypothetical protein
MGKEKLGNGKGEIRKGEMGKEKLGKEKLGKGKWERGNGKFWLERRSVR